MTYTYNFFGFNIKKSYLYAIATGLCSGIAIAKNLPKNNHYPYINEVKKSLADYYIHNSSVFVSVISGELAITLIGLIIFESLTKNPNANPTFIKIMKHLILMFSLITLSTIILHSFMNKS